MFSVVLIRGARGRSPRPPAATFVASFRAVITGGRPLVTGALFGDVHCSFDAARHLCDVNAPRRRGHGADNEYEVGGHFL